MSKEKDFFTTKIIGETEITYAFEKVNASQLISDVAALNNLKTTQNNVINDISNNLDNLISVLISYAQSTSPTLSQLENELKTL